MLGDERFGLPDDRQRVRLASLGRLAPGGDAVAAEDDADRRGLGGPDGRDVEAELESRAAPGHPRDTVAEALAGQSLAVGGGREGDARVRMQVVDMRRVEQAVHRRVDRGRGATAAMKAEVERIDHLVFALHAGVDADERSKPVEAQDRQARLGEGAEVTARALDRHELDRQSGRRVGGDGLGRCVAAGVVGVARVRAELMGPLEELDRPGRGLGCAWRLIGQTGRRLRPWDASRRHAPQPACLPPTRSATIFSA